MPIPMRPDFLRTFFNCPYRRQDILSSPSSHPRKRKQDDFTLYGGYYISIIFAE